MLFSRWYSLNGFSDVFFFMLQAKAVGKVLFDQVCKQLNLLEADYFGLEYQDATTKVHIIL